MINKMILTYTVSSSGFCPLRWAKFVSRTKLFHHIISSRYDFPQKITRTDITNKKAAVQRLFLRLNLAIQKQYLDGYLSGVNPSRYLSNKHYHILIKFSTNYDPHIRQSSSASPSLARAISSFISSGVMGFISTSCCSTVVACT
ncbi:hypothetical protein SAMN04488116_2455 [Flagellimonas flava]|uniref:Uncharacterized protein n=1 Tax=Flagellimonas flava TaxID=570519 RepID=A0A1M5MIP7_9FLAO|nr:hypothetical protein SAMN04488116_2455 [Allomuricauda flava]